MTPRSLLAPARLAGQPILRTQSDERLVDLVRAGSEPAFEAIVARYRRPLLRYCGRILSEERAEDAVQQTFVRAYDSMRSGDADLNLRPWLYRIAHNTSLNALRDRGLRHEELDETIDGVERPDQAFERRESLRDVVDAVNDLPARQRDAIVLRELEGRSYEEIAGQLGVTDGAVRQLLNRARTSLRAGVTAVTPAGLLLRIPFAGAEEPVASRVAELTAGAGAGALAAKTCATILVTGAVVGGVAAVPSGEDGDRGGDRPSRATAAKPSDEVAGGGVQREPARAARRADRGGDGAAGRGRSQRAESRGRGRGRNRGRGRGRGRSGEREEAGDDRSERGQSGPGEAERDADEDDRDDSSGRGRGRSGGDDDDSSGPGGGSNSGPGSGERVEPDDDNSGSGSGGHDPDDEDSSGPSGGSGSGSSGGSGKSGSDDEEDDD